MADGIEIGVDDLTTVACAAVRDLLAGIEADNVAVPVRLGQVYPEDLGPEGSIQVYSTSESFTQGAGRQGNRMERIDCTINVTVLFPLPIIKLAELDRKIGRVRAEIKERISADPYLQIDGHVWATDLEIRSIQKGLAGSGKATLAVNSLQLSCTIHAREGSRLPAQYNGG